jgi:hypothetical protein
MDFFKVSAEDIAQATSKDKAVFTDGEKVTFTIKELKEKEINGKNNLIISCAVSSESVTSNGKEHAFFISDSPTSVKTWIKILRCFFTDEQIAQGVDPLVLVANSFTSTAKMSTKDSKTYTNFYEFSAANDGSPVAGEAAKFDLF